MCVTADDPLTSIYGAFGKFTQTNSLELSDVSRVMITGVGSSYLSKPIYGLECCHVPEFESVGLGGLYLSGLDNAIIVSMGTGTSITHATIKDGKYAFNYLGGTGVGGGMIRDMMSSTTPAIFRKHIYASASIAGALLCALLIPVIGTTASMISGIVLIMLIRFLAAYYKLNLPRMHN